MTPRSTLTNKFPGQVFSDVAAALGLATGFAFGSTWCLLYPQNVNQLLMAMITPIALTAAFYRARDYAPSPSSLSNT
jgi:hypothetical protein